MATRRIRDPEAFGREAGDACRRLLGRDPVDVDWPASRSRRSLRVEFADGSVIATRRKRAERSQLEAHVLTTLHAAGAPVPAVLAYDGEWLLQEYIEGTRLPHVLVSGDDERARALLANAAAGLAQIHRIGDETGLVDKMVRLGAAKSWIKGFLDTPNRIGDALNIPVPEFDVETVAEMVRLDVPCFLKWDARPGNAVVRADETVAWFDWEHCGARNGLDDFAWLLADEYVPAISGLADIAVANRPDHLSEEQAHAYFGIYATFHTVVRLALVVHHKDGRDWWNEAMCLNDDKVRVTAAGARLLCARGAEFSGFHAATVPLSGWFEAVAEKLGVA